MIGNRDRFRELSKMFQTFHILDQSNVSGRT